MNARWSYVLGLLSLVAVAVWLAVPKNNPTTLQIIACDVGQGDAILITKGDKQILIDGGPNNKVLECLERYMPFWDREIELVILTHPDADHSTGLVEVFRRYDVGMMLSPGVDSGSQVYRLLINQVGGGDTQVINTVYEDRYRLGMIYLDIVHPSREYLVSYATPSMVGSDDPNDLSNILGAYTSSRSLNDFSVVAILKFGEFSALLTGDIEPRVSYSLAETLSELGYGENCGRINCMRFDYLKVPHHGSKNGLTENLLSATVPQLAVISAGKNNRHGHPHNDVVEMLESRGIVILRTDLMGDVVVSTDGKRLFVE